MPQDDIQLSASINLVTDAAKAAAAKKAVDDIKTGASSAAEEVQKVKPAASQATEFQRMGGSAEKSFAAINAATAVTEGGVMGVGSAVKNLAGQFPALNAAMGPIGLMLAGFAAWKKVVDSVTEAKARLAAGIRAIQIENLESKIRRTAEAYDQEYAAIERLADARSRLSDIEQSKDDAQLRRSLAELDLQRAREKANLDPSDAIAAREIDLKYSDKAAALREDSAARRSERETTALAAGLSDLIDKLRIAKEATQTLSKEFSDLSAQREKVRALAAAGKITWEEANKETDAIDKNMADTSARLKTAYEKKDSLQTPLAEMRGRREVAEIDRQTLGVQSIARQTESYNTGTSIDRDRGANIDALFSELNQAAEGSSAVFRNWARQQIAAKERENALTEEFMRQMIDLSAQNARAIESGAARMRRPGG